MIANRDALVDGTPGVDIYPELAPAPGEHVIKKHRYSGFFGTDLDIILREWGVDTVIISGTICTDTPPLFDRDFSDGFSPVPREISRKSEALKTGGDGC